MRLLMFDDARVGVATPAGGVVDITDLVGDGIQPRDRMTALVASWAALASDVAGAAASRPAVDRATIVVRAPLPRPSKILAAPVNYRLHQEEMGGATRYAALYLLLGCATVPLIWCRSIPSGLVFSLVAGLRLAALIGCQYILVGEATPAGRAGVRVGERLSRRRLDPASREVGAAARGRADEQEPGLALSVRDEGRRRDRLLR
jgi:hypothetical protein